MIPVTVRLFVYREPVDMRRGFDGLALIARETLGQDPRSGSLFLYANRRSDRLKALWWDTNGYCILYKRLHRAVFELASCRSEDGSSTLSVRIDGKKLCELLAGTPKRRKSCAKLRVVR